MNPLGDFSVRNQSLAIWAIVGFSVSIAAAVNVSRVEARLVFAAPCDVGFKVKIVVHAVEGIDSEDAGLLLSYRPGVP